MFRNHWITPFFFSTDVTLHRLRQTWRKGLWLNLKTLRITFFLCVLLTVQLCVICFKWRCTLLLRIFISTSLHVSGNCVPIISRTSCIYATLIFFTLYGWLSGLLQQTGQPPTHPNHLAGCNSDLDLSPLFCCVLVRVQTEQRRNPPPTFSNNYHCSAKSRHLNRSWFRSNS